MRSRTISKVITTVSITPCSKNAQGSGPLRQVVERALAAVATCCALVFVPAAEAEQTTDITQLRLERNEDGVLLSANVNFDLTPAIDDALAKGIPIFFVAEAVLFRDRWYWYDKEVAVAARHMRFSFQPLTRRWRLALSAGPIGNSGLTLGQTFDTREEALAAVRRISHWKIAEAGAVDADARYNVDFRFRLDVSQLPRPFQIGVVGQADWNISAMRNQRLTVENPR